MGKKHGAGRQAVASVAKVPSKPAAAAPVPVSNGVQAMDVDVDLESGSDDEGDGSFETEDSFVSAEELSGEESSSISGSIEDDDEEAWEDEESDEDGEESDADGDADEALLKIMALVEPDEIAQEELEALARMQVGDEDVDGLDGGEEEEEEEEEDGEEYEGLPPGSDNEDLAASIKRKVIKNDEAALVRLLEHMKPSSALDLDFFETQTLSHDEALSVPDVHDDITREVQLYKVALSAATRARSLFHASDKPFSRPSDYFAEMLKSDSTMEKIRSRLLDEQTRIKASEEARRQRGLKKFGKEVQTRKRVEREKEARRVKEGVNELRKKRKGGALEGRAGEDEFDIALDDALDNSSRPPKRSRFDGSDSRRDGASRGGLRGGGRGGSRMPRSARDAKFGRPKPVGAGRRSKENTKESSGTFAGFGGKGDGRKGFGGRGGSGFGGGSRGRGGKTRGGGPKRPGKSKRVARG